jgi:hypothetical protein
VSRKGPGELNRTGRVQVPRAGRPALTEPDPSFPLHKGDLYYRICATHISKLVYPCTDEENGRGLQAVNGLRRDWGWDPIPGLRAKAVWALLDIR